MARYSQYILFFFFSNSLTNIVVILIFRKKERGMIHIIPESYIGGSKLFFIYIGILGGGGGRLYFSIMWNVEHGNG